MARKIEPKELLKNPEVVKEIQRHLWIESEKAGHDIGFDRAAEDWLNRYAQSWMDYHMPGSEIPTAKPSPDQTPKTTQEVRSDTSKTETTDKIKKRRAKSYF